MNKKIFFSSIAPHRIDRENGMIKGVSLISIGLAKGHGVYVDEKTIDQVFELATEAETLKVKVDHGSGVLSTIGFLKNFSKDKEQVYGDLHIYESESQRDRIFEIAEKNPSHMGISLEFEFEIEKEKNKNFVRCTVLKTAALVSDPAANEALFENKLVEDVKLDNKEEEIISMNQKKKLSEDSTNDNDKKETTIDDLKKSIEDMGAVFSSRLAALEESAKDSEDPKATDKQDQPKPQNEEKSMSEDDVKKAAELAATEAVTKLAAQIGLKSLSAGVAQEKTEQTKKNFEELVAAKTIELGCKNKAMSFCMKNNVAEYSEYRIRFVDPTKK